MATVLGSQIAASENVTTGQSFYRGLDCQILISCSNALTRSYRLKRPCAPTEHCWQRYRGHLQCSRSKSRLCWRRSSWLPSCGHDPDVRGHRGSMLGRTPAGRSWLSRIGGMGRFSECRPTLPACLIAILGHPGSTSQQMVETLHIEQRYLYHNCTE